MHVLVLFIMALASLCCHVTLTLEKEITIMVLSCCFFLEGLCNVENTSTPSHGEYDIATQVQPTGFE